MLDSVQLLDEAVGSMLSLVLICVGRFLLHVALPPPSAVAGIRQYKRPGYTRGCNFPARRLALFGGDLVGFAGRFKPGVAVGTVAERLVGRIATPT